MASSIVSPDVTDCYHVNECSPHGICVIIDNSQFTNFQDCSGSNHDVTNITKTFEKLGYDITVLANLHYGMHLLFCYAFLGYFL